MKSDYQFYQISIKVLLKKKGKVLILRDENDLIDLPGGRIEKKEAKSSIEQIIRREIKEELGPKVSFKLKNPIFHFRVYSKQYKYWVLIIVHEGEYLGGNITLSKEHKSYEWIDKKKVKVLKKDFYKENKEKYMVFKQYFEQ